MTIYLEEVTFSTRAAAARQAVVLDFGDGWLTSSARDMIRIAAFAGFDLQELRRRVAMSTRPDCSANSASVERVMAEMLAEFDALAGARS